jgi:hypothetical protein
MIIATRGEAPATLDCPMCGTVMRKVEYRLALPMGHEWAWFVVCAEPGRHYEYSCAAHHNELRAVHELMGCQDMWIERSKEFQHEIVQ